MPELNIIQAPNDILTVSSTLVEDTESASVLQKLLEQWELLPTNKLGLAAPQIGINKNMAIVLGTPMMNMSFTAADQPEIDTEGCFSLDMGEEEFTKWRPKYGWAKWVDPVTHLPNERKLNGLEARVFQHELDHINGKLCNS